MAGKKVGDIDLHRSMESEVPTDPEQEEPEWQELPADDSESEQR
jgi:hypothetical protein